MRERNSPKRRAARAIVALDPTFQFMMSPPRDAPVDEAYASRARPPLIFNRGQTKRSCSSSQLHCPGPRSPPRHDLSRSGLGARSACERIVADAPLGADCPVVVAAGLMSGASTCRPKVGPLREPHSTLIEALDRQPSPENKHCR